MMEDARYLTVRETCAKLRMDYETVIRLIKAGTLQAIRSQSERGWRILDPTPELVERAQASHEEVHVEHVQLLSTAEVAEVLGSTVLYIQKLVKDKKLIPQTTGAFGHKKGRGLQMKMFTVAEIRRYLWKREKSKRRKLGTRVIRLQRLVAWAKIVLEHELHSDAERIQARDELNYEIDAILAMPEPQRTLSLVDLWEKLDKVEYIAGLVDQKKAAK